MVVHIPTDPITAFLVQDFKLIGPFAIVDSEWLELKLHMLKPVRRIRRVVEDRPAAFGDHRNHAH